MDIKIIMAVVFALLLGFIGYNSYESLQSKKRLEARMAEIDSLNASNVQVVASLSRVEPDPVQAVTKESAESIAESKESICESVTGVAESAMKARLSGVPIQTALSSLDKIDDSDKSNAVIKRLYKAIITDAYRMPNFSTDKYQEEAVREFGLKQYLTCTDTLAKT